MIEVNPPLKVCGIIPMKIALLAIALISTVFGIINFCGVINYGGYQNEVYFYFYQACGFLSPIALIYTLCKKDDIIAYLAIYFHTIYLFVTSIVLVVGVLLVLLIMSPSDTKSLFLIASLVQTAYTLFAFYANYIFVSFYTHYDDIVPDAPSSTQVSNIQPTTTNYEQI